MYICTYSAGIAITPDLSSEFELEGLRQDTVCDMTHSPVCDMTHSPVCDMTHLCTT